MKSVRLSVRKVVELALRCGDIDSRFTDVGDAMQEGAQAHRMLQRQYPKHYRKEVSVSASVNIGGVDAIIFGRADGVADEEGMLIVDEIKTTTLPIEMLEKQQEVHLAQAKCYAYLLLFGDKRLDRYGGKSVTVQLTYFQLESQELMRRSYVIHLDELNAFFTDLCEKYGVWLRLESEWQTLRNQSIAALQFPYPEYRAGQRKLAIAVYRSIENGKKLYVQAPTGIGKTISSLFPAIKSLGEGKVEKLFYLTAKTITRTVAEDAVRRMHAAGLRFKSLTLRAKDKICFMEETACNPESCPYAKGHFDRINDALLQMLYNEDLLTADVIMHYAERFKVCPHEMALDAALWSDLVVGDYNHVFDPVVYLHRFFGQSHAEGAYAFLVDEAHNLADRVRDMYTAQLNKSAFYSVSKLLVGRDKSLSKLRAALKSINRYFLDLRKELEVAAQNAVATAEADCVFNQLLRAFLLLAGEWLSDSRNKMHDGYDPLLSLYFEAMAFETISDLYSPAFTCIKEKLEHDLALTYFCLDPSEMIAKRLTHAVSTIMFSATLTPLGYYRELLGGTESDYSLDLPSPFPQQNLQLLIHTGISTKYRAREDSVAPIVDAIAAVYNRRKGNYLAFFPSYTYMRAVYAAFHETYDDLPCVMQNSSMDEAERLAFLERFEINQEEGFIGFCVLGGLFSEGIDLTGDRLIGAIIVGVGLPKITFRQDLIRNYYQEKNGYGFDFAYVFPGMNKVLQAAGRVIRTETDQGLALLIDSRFGENRYKALYPSHWSHGKEIKSMREFMRFLVE